MTWTEYIVFCVGCFTLARRSRTLPAWLTRLFCVVGLHDYQLVVPMRGSRLCFYASCRWCRTTTEHWYTL